MRAANSSQPPSHSHSHSHQLQLQNLHKMLDSQIQTVNTLFQKDNAFEQIQAKLKILEVKLNSIKDNQSYGGCPPHQYQHQGVTYPNQKGKDRSKGKPLNEEKQTDKISKQNEESYFAFQSLSNYKRMKKSNNKGEKSSQQQQKIRNSGQNRSSGKKLNFDQNIQQQEYQSQQSTYKKKTNKNIKKIKSQKLFMTNETKKRSKSTNKYQNKQKPVSREESTKKQRISISKSQKKYQSSKKHQNQFIDQKTPSQIRSFNKMAYSYSNLNSNSNSNLKCTSNPNQFAFKGSEINKQKLKQIIKNNETKKLHKQLANFRTQNKNLQKQVRQLRAYRDQYQKLKDLFAKEEKLRKSRRGY